LQRAVKKKSDDRKEGSQYESVSANDMMRANNVLQNSMTHECSISGNSSSNGITAPRSLDFESADNHNKKVAPPVAAAAAPNDNSNGGTAIGPPQQQQQMQQQQSKAFRLRSLTANANLRTNDEIHQSIDLCPVLQTFLDTPQMQRLRHISQLGTSDLVFINANHSRFEHSLGVAHLAERMCKRIMDRQPALHCTKKDVLCIKLAGLLHDIGHGPFSHVYEDFITSALPRHLNKQRLSDQGDSYYASLPPIPQDWKHECVSLMMIDAALEYLGLQIDLSSLDEPLRQIGHGIDARSMRVFDISTSSSSSSENHHHHHHADNDDNDDDYILTSRDFVFIKECIWGQPLPEVLEYFLRENTTTKATTAVSAEAQLSIGFVGRPSVEKEWLYDIVSNRHSGLDVDKVSAALFCFCLPIVCHL
jgi:deoxynucleoside triphosphate triphosphohydrolase SAMHD1